MRSSQRRGQIDGINNLSEVEMGRKKQPERQRRSQRRTVFAPQPKDDSEHPAVISVELDEDEDVEWTWTHTSDGQSVVTGYTIIKKAEKPREFAESSE